MAIDPKYGRVTLEDGTIGYDEPVVVFRAQDGLLPAVIRMYRELCIAADVPSPHIVELGNTLEQILEWQQDHFTKMPESRG